MSAESNKQELIRNRAYQIWEQEGRPAGRDVEHWVLAQEGVHTDEIKDFNNRLTKAEKAPSRTFQRIRKAIGSHVFTGDVCSSVVRKKKSKVKVK